MATLPRLRPLGVDSTKPGGEVWPPSIRASSVRSGSVSTPGSMSRDRSRSRWSLGTEAPRGRPPGGRRSGRGLAGRAGGGWAAIDGAIRRTGDGAAGAGMVLLTPPAPSGLLRVLVGRGPAAGGRAAMLWRVRDSASRFELSFEAGRFDSEWSIEPCPSSWRPSRSSSRPSTTFRSSTTDSRSRSSSTAVWRSDVDSKILACPTLTASASPRRPSGGGPACGLRGPSPHDRVTDDSTSERRGFGWVTLDRLGRLRGAVRTARRQAHDLGGKRWSRIHDAVRSI